MPSHAVGFVVDPCFFIISFFSCHNELSATIGDTCQAWNAGLWRGCNGYQVQEINTSYFMKSYGKCDGSQPVYVIRPQSTVRETCVRQFFL